MSDVWHDGTSLRQWRLHNFKSVRDATVDLAPLTVVVGENSAGKSTLLQSIRAVVQAVDATGSAFPLNGDLVRLGTYKETRSASAPDDDSQIGVGGKFHVGARGPYYMHSSGIRYARGWRARGAVTDDDAELDWEIRLGGSPVNQPGQTVLRSSRTTVTSRRGVSAVSSAERTAAPTSADPGYFGRTADGNTGYELIDVEHRGGFAFRGHYETDLVGHLIRQWLEAAQSMVFAAVRSGDDAPRPAKGSEALPAVIADDLRAVIDEAGGAEAAAGAPFERRAQTLLQARFADRPPMDISRLLENFRDTVEHVTRLVAVHRIASRNADMPEAVLEGTLAVREFLTERVLHLGPLRMDPQVVYTTAPVARGGFIGAKGEYSAAVLQTHGGATVAVPLPGRAGSHNVPLGIAVNRWAAYLGIGDAFSTTDKGRLGLELAVRQPHVDMDLDLTSVGTGVSQLLPVLVMCLQAPAGSLLLLEQPELHLNPAVQQRLADFLLAVAANGRQTIVETHSDYMVYRLRRRVAEDPADDVRRRLTILFAERNNGVSTYTAVQPSRDGSLPEWPRGFFDQAAADAEALLRAGMRKRHAHAGPGEE